MTTLYYTHPDFLAHDTGPGHPECPARLTSIARILGTDRFSLLHNISAPKLSADAAQIRLIHTQRHIDAIMNAIPAQGIRLLDSDTVVSPGSADAALRAIGAVCDAVDRVCTGQADNAFCALRPPGHHAEPEQAMGFCLFNNIAIAAAHARSQYHLQRVAIVDFDVHHGNGTQAAFYRQVDVLYASTHEMPLYPGTGLATETGAGNIVNVPLTPGSSGEEFRRKMQQIIFPALHSFQPQLLLISAGFDAHRADPLSTLQWTEQDYAWVTRELLSIADACCSGRIISTLEGGYDLPALAKSVAAHVAVLAGIER